MDNLSTKVITIDGKNPTLKSQYLEVLSALHNSEIVAFPTETVYGLGAIWNDNKAIENIFKAKNRPLDNPLIVHESSVSRMRSYYAEWDLVAEILTSHFCPGPFTLIMKKSDAVQSLATAGLNTIGLRIPSHPVAHALIAYLGTGIAAPSANISGRPSPTNFKDCYEDLNGIVPYIIDGGESEVGLESTIVSWVNDKLELLRPGAVSAESILAVLEKHAIKIPLIEKKHVEEGETPRAPGQKYRHYAPKADVIILDGNTFDDKLRQIQMHRHNKSKFGAFISRAFSDYLHRENNPILMEEIVFEDNAYGSKEEAASHKLFSAFREFDRLSCDIIFVEELPQIGIGSAYMNRLERASEKK